MAVLTCFLVEPSPVLQQSLVATLEEMLPLQVIGIGADERSSVAWMADGTHRCQLMLIDMCLRQGSGLEVLRRARLLRPDSRLVVLTDDATPVVRRHAQQLGADRVFDKAAELDELLAYCAALARTAP